MRRDDAKPPRVGPSFYGASVDGHRVHGTDRADQLRLAARRFPCIFLCKSDRRDTDRRRQATARARARFGKRPFDGLLTIIGFLDSRSSMLRDRDAEHVFGLVAQDHDAAGKSPGGHVVRERRSTTAEFPAEFLAEFSAEFPAWTWLAFAECAARGHAGRRGDGTGARRPVFRDSNRPTLRRLSHRVVRSAIDPLWTRLQTARLYRQ